MSKTDSITGIFGGSAMLFGSDEMKELLIKAYKSPKQYYEKAMREVYNSVWCYAYSWVSKGFEANVLWEGSKPLYTRDLTEEDRQDAVSEILMAVRGALDKFIINMLEKNFSEAQRQAWLRRVIYNKLAGFLKRLPPKRKENDEETVNRVGDSSVKDFTDVLRFKEKLLCMVKLACSAPYKQEKVLVYLFNMFIYRETTGRKKNCNSKKTCKQINGKSWFELVKYLQSAFFCVYNVRVTAKEIHSFFNAFGDVVATEKGKEICSLEPKTVTDWTNRMNTFMFENKHKINEADGGDCNDNN